MKNYKNTGSVSPIIPLLVIVTFAILGFFFWNTQNPGNSSAPEDIAVKNNNQIPVPQSTNPQASTKSIKAGGPPTPPRAPQPKAVPLNSVKKKAKAHYLSAVNAIENNKPEEAINSLHDAFNEEPRLVDNTLLDQSFRKLRKNPNFEKLLKIQGRNVYEDLGKGPIELPQ